MIKITKKHYKGKVRDLIFNGTDYYYANTNKGNKYIKVHNCDIDWDSELGGREKVLEYLIHKYGQENVCNVVTFQKFKVKSAINDISRGLGKDTSMKSTLARKIVKLPEFDDKNSFKGSLKEFFKELKKTTDDNEIIEWINNNQDTIRLADKLVGQMRGLGTHAGGIVVTPRPIYEFIPVTRGTGNLVTAFSEADGSSKDLSELGILKLDVLGLQTLNILKNCMSAIKEDKGIDLFEYINYLPLDDKLMLEEFSKGDNYGIFQMERSKMFIDAFHKAGAKIDSFEDIVAINAMNRPGPLEKYINKYGLWKVIDSGEKKISETELKIINQERYPFPFMKDILGSTFGAVLYQEQIMSLVCELTGMTFGESDIFRRSIAWTEDHPKYHTVKALFDGVEEAMIKKGYTLEDAKFFLQFLRDVSGYSFNRSHSVAYAYIAWQCLYFKTYYPAYFYCACLNQESDTDQIKLVINFAKASGIKVKPISINKSRFLSSVENDDTIRLGYKLLKGMGASAQAELNVLKLHECKTMFDVMEKPFKKINSTALNNLIDLGCFDELDENRNRVKKLFELYKEPKIEKWFTRKRNPIELKTMPEILSENFDTDVVLGIAQRVFNEPNPHFKLIKELSTYFSNISYDKELIEEHTIEKEKELLGFQMTINSKFQAFIDRISKDGFKPITQVIKENEDLDFFGNCYFEIRSCDVAFTKTGKPFLKFVLNDGQKDYKANMWLNGPKDEANIEKYLKAQFGIGNLKRNDFGYNIQKLEIPKY